MSRKECRTRQPAVETIPSLTIPATSTVKAGERQKLPEPDFTLIDNTNTANRTLSLCMQSQDLLSIPKTIRRSRSIDTNMTNIHNKEAELFAKRDQGNRNFTPLAIERVVGDT
ncbi:hypothetical protein ColTof4_05444 [Colletotrichum tofieldiae]|nr:hypothetical protein ColTof3_10304 [Colletotrichum tofieldiae]GKT73021.1 hypothetical protein ColTof4_05444 [Colletotrichum tofieldiae]GKT89128.1 hypothetical protein Ct61P_06978 [Colletotrichum tofieldiae]